MIFQLVGLCCICVLSAFWFKKRSTLEPPELSGRLPIVGHAYKLMGDAVRFYKTIQGFSEECLEKGGVITVNLGPYKAIGVADPEDCFKISETCVQKHYMYDFLKPLCGNGLITADVPTWKKNRKMLNPAFNKQVLDSFIEIFYTQAISLVDQLATELGKPFDHEILLKKNSMETICSTSFGVDASEYSDLHKEYLPRFIKLMEGFNNRIQKFWYHSNFIYNMTTAKIKQEELLKHMFTLSRTIIQKKKLEMASLANTKITTGKFKPFIELILELSNSAGCFTDEQIREETDTIISAGHETNAALLTFTLTMLGSHKDVQEKAYNEVLRVLGNFENNIVKDDLPKLVYVEAVLKETLRLHPIVPIIGRCIDKDVKLKNYTIKANSGCIISVYGVNRHSIWGPDADQFRPERWLDKETLPDLKYFGSFGLGRRSCIGKAYAMMSMKITLAHVLRNYSISSDVSKMVIKMGLTATPESGHYITLSRRNQ